MRPSPPPAASAPQEGPRGRVPDEPSRCLAEGQRPASLQAQGTAPKKEKAPGSRGPLRAGGEHRRPRAPNRERRNGSVPAMPHTQKKAPRSYPLSNRRGVRAPLAPASPKQKQRSRADTLLETHWPVLLCRRGQVDLFLGLGKRWASESRLRREGFFREKACVSRSASGSRACSGADLLFDVDGVMKKKLVDEDGARM